MAEENFRFCRKCLTRDIIDKDDYFKTLHQLIENIPKDQKADTTLYEARLADCQACERLYDGLCSACGCYVELRAAKASNDCPYSKWSK